MRKASKLVAVLALAAMAMAAFMVPAVAKKGQGKGKKATIVSWDEGTRTLVLTNKKAYEQTFTVAADAKLTKVVPCEDDSDGSTEDPAEGEGDSTEGEDVKTCGNMAATTADLVPGYRVLNWKERDGVVSRLKVKVPSADDSQESTEDDSSGDGTGVTTP